MQTLNDTTQDGAAAIETPLIRKLHQFIPLRRDEIAALGRLGGAAHRARPLDVLLDQGRSSGVAVLLHSGWAIRHRTLRDGRRQIIDFVLPGDLCDPSGYFQRQSDYAVSAVTDAVYTLVRAEEILDLIASSPRLGAFFWWLEAQEEQYLRAHLVAVGRLSAYERIAYLVWELWTRLRAVGLAEQQSFALPATLELIADATGLSHVHVSRTLSRMEREGMLRRVDRRYDILDPARFRQIAQVEEQSGSRRLPDAVAERLGRY